MYIYKTTNLINGKIYIGQSSKHPDKSKNYLGSGRDLIKSLKKYGKQNFIKEILRICKSKIELDIFEEIYIKRFNSIDKKIGYNRAISVKATSLGYQHTEDFKQLVSKNMKGNTYAKGNKLTDETKKLMSENKKISMLGQGNHMFGKKGEECPNYGKQHSEETKKILAEHSRGNQYNVGKKRTEETKKKMSDAQKAFLNHPIYGQERKRILLERGRNSKKQSKQIT